jgi:DNA-binding MarR family transcriptional regulator
VNPRRKSSFQEAHEQELSAVHELEALQDQLDRLRSRLAEQPSSTPVAFNSEFSAQLVKEIVRSRRQRDKLFGTELFGEPAWDILLELFVAEQSRRKLSVTSACLASAVPPTTAIRWVEKLENEGWVRRENDPRDRRRSWVVLTSKGSNAMRSYLEALTVRPL